MLAGYSSAGERKHTHRRDDVPFVKVPSERSCAHFLSSFRFYRPARSSGAPQSSGMPEAHSTFLQGISAVVGTHGGKDGLEHMERMLSSMAYLFGCSLVNFRTDF